MSFAYERIFCIIRTVIVVDSEKSPEIKALNNTAAANAIQIQKGKIFRCSFIVEM